ncbi:hypothetical protein OIU76_011803 [Salix suchowensis]|nr:hypothetical protein OIU76_011803 [Salix suchowensis]
MNYALVITLRYYRQNVVQKTCMQFQSMMETKNKQSACSCLSKFLQEQSITTELNEHCKPKTHQVYISESKG